MRTEIVAGKRAVLEAVRSGVVDEVLVAKGSRRSPGMRDVVAAARAAHVAVREVDRADLDALDADHRGVSARLLKVAPMLGERDLASREWAADAIVVVLDGIEDPQNLGAAARTVEAAGASMLITRTHRSAPPTAAAVRASAGALLHLSHARVANLSRALDRLRDEGFTTVGLDERAERSIFDERCPDGRVALVVGSEGAGISRLVREHCDLLVSVPMHGKVGSLNAAASLAVVLYAYVLASRGRSAR
ncbi:MAG TPA: 23S rRNA (guanosine(2251)-2'-O)-methyltransferase RlmB [Actinomycetota bacterium]|nr:23S rRNA (guanosine(2251)-2'-O)-methyltransferase RlmB [Actinomycetota bacterium]